MSTDSTPQALAGAAMPLIDGGNGRDPFPVLTITMGAIGAVHGSGLAWRASPNSTCSNRR
ncbi:hypothetical protein [Streptomyces diastatochromogenes]|uniref:hypothetical protein n=1 Tax=Streptomyces diastatochromogenes TaxID=42236 RepID=UPI0036CA42CF